MAAHDVGEARGEVTVDIHVTPTLIIPGALRILMERQRQVDAEGWTPEHDDQHDSGQLMHAAECYLAMAMGGLDGTHYWPWHDDWWKPSDDPIRNLEKAGALIAAEIDRLQRARS